MQKIWKRFVLSLILPVVITHLLPPPIPVSFIWFIALPIGIANFLNWNVSDLYIALTSIILFYLVNSVVVFLFLKPTIVWFLSKTKRKMINGNFIARIVNTSVEISRKTLIEAMIWLEI